MNFKRTELDCALQARWPKDLVERLVTPPSVTVATQEGEAELPQFLLLLAGALDGPAGEALSVESPVVIAPEVSNAVIATLVSLLSSGRWDSYILLSQNFQQVLSEHHQVCLWLTRRR